MRILILASVIGGAVDGAEIKIELGPKGGLNFATMTGDLADTSAMGDGPEASYLVRGAGGVFVSIILTDSWSIQPEFLYSQKAGKWEEVYTEGYFTATATQEIEVEYIEIPVLAKFTFPQSGKFKPFLCAGPALAFSTASSVKIVNTVDSSGTRVYYFDDYFSNIHNAKSLIFEGCVGIGLNWQLGSNRLTLEGRYTRSLGRIFDDVDDFGAIPEDDAAVADYPSGEGSKLNHSVFTFIIGYGFSL